MNEKRILVAFDSSDNAFRAVDYVGGIVGGGEGFEVTLLHVERLPERDYYADEKSWKASCVKQEEDMREALTKGGRMLLEKGLEKDNMTVEYMVSCGSPLHRREMCSMGTSVALDVLRVAKEGEFGTIALGRRGVSKAEEFLFGSVSTKIIHTAKDCTVWVVA